MAAAAIVSPEELDPDAGGSQREIALALGRLQEAGAPGARRQVKVHRDDELAGGEGGGERAAEEILRRDLPRVRRRSDFDLAVQEHREDGQLGGGVRMGNAPSDGAALAYGRVRDACDGFLYHRSLFDDRAVTQELGVPHQGADGNAAAVRPNAPHCGCVEPVDVDEHRRTREPEVHHGHQALAARERSCLVPVLGQDGERFLRCGGPDVLERRRLHRVLRVRHA